MYSIGLIITGAYLLLFYILPYLHLGYGSFWKLIPLIGIVGGGLLVAGGGTKSELHWGFRIVGAWFVLSLLLPLLGIYFNYMDVMLEILGIVGGVLLFMSGPNQYRRQVGTILLGVYAIYICALPLLHIYALPFVVAVILGIATGIFLVVRR